MQSVPVSFPGSNAAVHVAAAAHDVDQTEDSSVCRASGAPVMTKQLVRAQCKKHGGFTTEELNEKLFLHHFGFSTVENLELYTGCRVLYLSHNALHDLRPLSSLVNLTALYAANNALESCTMLPRLPKLEICDLSHNYIANLKGLSAAAPQLETLLVSHNRIERMQDDEFGSFTRLSSIDLSHNKLADDEKLLSALSREALRTTLRTLVLDGNALQRTARHYRKRVIAQFPSLRMLDVLPVSPEEREKSEAFIRGGPPAESAAAAAIAERAAAERDAQFRYHSSFLATARGRRFTQGQRTSPTTYFLDHAAPAAGHDDDDDDVGDVFIPSSTP